MISYTLPLTLLRPLFSYTLWSRLGFLFSYILTSLLVLEVVRLFYTDSNKREVEKMLDAYSSSKPTSHRSASASSKLEASRLGASRSASPPMKRMRVPIEALERARTPSPAATVATRTPEGQERKRRVSVSPVTIHQQVSPQHSSSTHQQQYSSSTLQQSSSLRDSAKDATPTRRLRKRSDTLTSTGSSSSSTRRRREDSPVVEGERRARSKEAKGSSSRLEKMLRARA